MSNVFALAESIIRKERKNVDKRVFALMKDLEHENTLLPETPFRILQRMLKIYRGVKPVISVIIKLPLVPTTWSSAVEGFLRSLDALDVPEVIAQFKAGKDL